MARTGPFVGGAVRAGALVVGALVLTGCGLFGEDNSRAVQTYGAEATQPDDAEATGSSETPTTSAAETSSTSSTSTVESAPGPVAETATRPPWLGTRTLPTTGDGVVVPQTTPPELENRQLPTVDTLAPPPSAAPFRSTMEPVDAATLERSTWKEGCPVEPEELTYLTLSFWGFDGLPHTGEMIVNSTVADDVVSVFAALFDSGYPIEEMRLVTDEDLTAPPTGDGNNTGSFVCRPVTGGTKFSQHAYGLAIDINPFLNPYQRGDLVLPELAAFYLERAAEQPGVITEGDVVVTAFEAIGWSWGGRWSSLKDYQHFSVNNR